MVFTFTERRRNIVNMVRTYMNLFSFQKQKKNTTIIKLHISGNRITHVEVLPVTRPVTVFPKQWLLPRHAYKAYGECNVFTISVLPSVNRWGGGGAPGICTIWPSLRA